jgi:hypothetical protein
MAFRFGGALASPDWPSAVLERAGDPTAPGGVGAAASIGEGLRAGRSPSASASAQGEPGPRRAAQTVANASAGRSMAVRSAAAICWALSGAPASALRA